MNAFWDTSAVLALVFEEEASAAAVEAWSASDVDYAWSWMKAEAISGTARRGATPEQWKSLNRLLASFYYADITSEQIEALCRANREWRLRAGDAGHLFCFQRISRVLPDAALVCFDEEINSAADALSLRRWGNSPDAKERSPKVKEDRGAYATPRALHRQVRSA